MTEVNVLFHFLEGLRGDDVLNPAGVADRRFLTDPDGHEVVGKKHVSFVDFCSNRLSLFSQE